MQDYITTNELAALLKVKKNTIERWRTNRECPIQWIKVKRRVLYAMTDVRTYLEKQKCDRVSTG
ncbi:MAG: helix-turn-helix domain-containing protein [Alphaproteobacteria bacterium]|nr:helix-turn-helix domain-containing protein [Alphaproteobacteria bacterium]